MSRAEKERLIQALAGTAEALGQALSPAALAVYVEDLGGYPVESVLRALQSVRREARGRLTVKAILDRLGASSGYIGGSEAWAMAQVAADERATVVWTGEMQRAWGVAQPLMAAGDKVGARMAFLEAYERFCTEARAAGRVPEITVSRGWDSALVAPAVERAAAAGLALGVSDEDMPMLIGVDLAKGPDSTVLAIVGPEQGRLRLLAEEKDGRNDTSAGITQPIIAATQNERLLPEQREQLRALAKELEQGRDRRARQEDEAAERERAELEATKARCLADLERASRAE